MFLFELFFTAVCFSMDTMGNKGYNLPICIDIHNPLLHSFINIILSLKHSVTWCHCLGVRMSVLQILKDYHRSIIGWHSLLLAVAPSFRCWSVSQVPPPAPPSTFRLLPGGDQDCLHLHTMLHPRPSFLCFDCHWQWWRWWWRWWRWWRWCHY